MPEVGLDSLNAESDLRVCQRRASRNPRTMPSVIADRSATTGLVWKQKLHLVSSLPHRRSVCATGGPVHLAPRLGFRVADHRAHSVLDFAPDVAGSPSRHDLRQPSASPDPTFGAPKRSLNHTSLMFVAHTATMRNLSRPQLLMRATRQVLFGA